MTQKITMTNFFVIGALLTTRKDAMTLSDLEECLRTEGPHLRAKLIKTQIDDLAFQRAMIALWTKNKERLSWDTVTSFCHLFESYFHMCKRHIVSKANYSHVISDRIIWDYSYVEGKEYQDSESHMDRDNPSLKVFINPWETLQSEACEYLELITNLKTRTICMDYYVKGYTHAEVAQRAGISKTWAQQLLIQGIEEIKEQLHTLESIN